MRTRQIEILGQPDQPTIMPVQLLLLLCKKIVKLRYLDYLDY